MIDVSEPVDNELEEIKIDSKKVKRMITRIYQLEKSNAKTSKYGERDMKELIKKIIEEEVEKCY